MRGIYAYWEGPPMHWFYRLCWETVKRHNPCAVLLGRADVEEALGPIPRELDEVYIVHRCDWIRKAWVHKHGGAWVDVDFICWADLSWLAETPFDFLGWQEWHGTGTMDNFFAARPGSPILAEAADYALRQVQQFGRDVQWLATNAHAMNYAIGSHRWGSYAHLPTHLVGPVSVMDPGWFTADDPNPEAAAGFRSLGFMCSMHGLRGWLDSVGSPDKLLAGSSRLAALLRRGLG